MNPEPIQNVVPPEMLERYLTRQRWFGAQSAEGAEVFGVEVLAQGLPGLVRLVVDVGGDRYQVILGTRLADQRPEWLHGHDGAVLGELDSYWAPGLGVSDTGGRHLVVYDAVFDPELAMTLLQLVAPGTQALRPRVMGVEQSNTSIVFDDKLVLKVFRRLVQGHNPEVEMTEALAAGGFEWIAAPIASLAGAGGHLGIVQPFLAGGVDGWALALTSLRDLLAQHDTQQVPVIDFNSPPPMSPDPTGAGADFSAEAARLGRLTAQMHAALARAFGSVPAQADQWADGIATEVAALDPADVEAAGASQIVADMRQVDPGLALRVHGDYHLGQVMRTDSGWFVLDFEGEPARPIEARRRPTSPLRDVAGMLRSFHYAAAVASADRDQAAQDVAHAWENCNRDAFLEGYLATAAHAGFLPDDRGAVDTLIAAFELEKAAYELAYERAHRPHWQSIPRAALRRLTRR